MQASPGIYAQLPGRICGHCHAKNSNWLKLMAIYLSSLPLEVGSLQQTSESQNTSDKFHQCNCCLGRETESWRSSIFPELSSFIFMLRLLWVWPPGRPPSFLCIFYKPHYFLNTSLSGRIKYSGLSFTFPAPTVKSLFLESHSSEKNFILLI